NLEDDLWFIIERSFEDYKSNIPIWLDDNLLIRILEKDRINTFFFFCNLYFVLILFMSNNKVFFYVIHICSMSSFHIKVSLSAQILNKNSSCNQIVFLCCCKLNSLETIREFFSNKLGRNISFNIFWMLKYCTKKSNIMSYTI